MRLCSNTSLVPRPWPVWERDRPHTCLKNYEERWCLCCIVESLPYCKPFRRRMLSGGRKDYQLPRLKVGTHKNASVCDIWSVTWVNRDLLVKKEIFFERALYCFSRSGNLTLVALFLSSVVIFVLLLQSWSFFLESLEQLLFTFSWRHSGRWATFEHGKPTLPVLWA